MEFDLSLLITMDRIDVSCEKQFADGEPCFLEQFPPSRGFCRFAQLLPTARNAPLAEGWFPATPHEQHATVPQDNDTDPDARRIRV